MENAFSRQMHVSARYSGDGVNSPSVSSSLPVTITPEQSRTYVGAVSGGAFATAPISVGYGLVMPLGIIVAGNSGAGYPSAKLTITADGAPITNGAVYDYDAGTYSPSSLLLNYGERSSLMTSLPSSQARRVLVPGRNHHHSRHHTIRLDYAGDANVKGTIAPYPLPYPSSVDSYVSFGTDVITAFGSQPVTLTAMIGSDIQLYVSTGNVTLSNGATTLRVV